MNAEFHVELQSIEVKFKKIITCARAGSFGQKLHLSFKHFEVLKSNDTAWLYRDKDQCSTNRIAHELDTANFFGMAIVDLTSGRAVEAAILEAVTNHYPVNQSKLKEIVKMYLPDVGVNRIRGIADSMANAGKLASTSVKQRSRVYDLP